METKNNSPYVSIGHIVLIKAHDFAYKKTGI
jgi:hypothetical protein